MRVIAITGGIGAGKSTVTDLYRELGARVVDADAISRTLTAPGGEVLPALREIFGDAVFRPDGTLNRAALAARVFQDGQELARLNAVLHPRITRRILAELNSLRDAGSEIVLLDVPLLFEVGMDRLADTVVCVTASEDTRVRRVCARDGISPEEARSRIRRQNPTQRNEALSDYVLVNDGALETTLAEARALWARMLAEGPRRRIESE